MGTLKVQPSTLPPAKPYEPSAIMRWLYRRFFAHIRVDERWSGAVREAAQRGIVVYVMRSISFLDFLCLDFLLKRFSLPLVRFVNDLGLWILEPFGKGGRRLRLRRQIPEDRALAQTIQEQVSALLFLRRPPRLGQKQQRKGAQTDTDLIGVLIATQREVQRPILLVPQTFVWSKRSASARPGLLDVFLGPREWPGMIRVFFQFVFNYRNALLRSGEPFDLQAFLAQHDRLTDEEIADKVRYALLRRIERERAIVIGPTQKSPGRIRQELLSSPRIRRHIDAMARTTDKSVAQIERLATKDLKRLCAAQDPAMLGLFHRFFDRVWNRIYDGLEVDQEGIERLRAAAREGAVVLLPSHKSHIDYLVLSDVLYINALSPPLIAAGDNLSFWPLGPLLRRAGAFFIRRSFKGKKLYAALVDAYMRKLLLEGHSIEFFIEGGRSRTGKLLPPKFGLLSMVVDAALLLNGRKISFVPVSIGYERIIEQRSYVHELSGGEKTKENLGGLLKAPRLLRSRYGRLYVQFGEVLDFDTFRRDVADGEKGELPPGTRRTLVQRLAHRAVYEMNRVTIVTPTALVAMALLSHRRRGMPESELLATVQLLATGLRRENAPFAATLANDDGVRADAVREATRLFMDGKLVARNDDHEEPIYAVPDERRIGLEYYKNNILHFFVPSALIASALVGAEDDEPSATNLRERVRQLSRLFKYEFMYQADASYDDIFGVTLEKMLQWGELEQLADRIHIAAEGRPMVELLRTMLRTYFESYRLAVEGVRLLLPGPMSRKEWTKKTLDLGQRGYLAGKIEGRESLQSARLDNAILALRDHQIIRTSDVGSVTLGDAVKEEADIDELAHKLGSFVE